MRHRSLVASVALFVSLPAGLVLGVLAHLAR